MALYFRRSPIHQTGHLNNSLIHYNWTSVTCLILENAVSQSLCKSEDLNISEKLFCSFCNAKFEDQVQQRLHYKLDWHRYNLKRKLDDLKPITEEKFTQLAGVRTRLLHVNLSVITFSYFHFILQIVVLVTIITTTAAATTTTTATAAVTTTTTTTKPRKKPSEAGNFKMLAIVSLIVNSHSCAFSLHFKCLHE